MSSASEYFKKPVPAWEAHPLVRYWRSVMQDPGVGQIRMELYRPKEGLVFRPAVIFVHVRREGGVELAPQQVDWEDVVNEGLVHLQVRAVSAENEAQRFSLMLMSALASVEAHFGETFFSSVLRQTIAEGPFAAGPNVSKKLARITPSPTVREKSWAECSEMIRNAIAGRWEELTSSERLGYSEEESEEILESAIAHYLDERFNISNRELLGWG